MQIELKEEPSERKRHQSTPDDLLPLAEKYKGEVIKPKDIDPKDVERLLEEYATRPEVDLYTVADTLNISNAQLYRLLKNEKFAELHEQAKIRRYERLMIEGYKLVHRPIQQFDDGEELSKEFVVACRNAANYCLHMSQAFSPEVNNKRNGDKGNVNIQINIPQLHHLGGS